MEQNFLKIFPPETQKVILQLYDTILERALRKIYQNLSEEKKAAMAEIFDSGTPAEKDKFLQECLGNLDEVLLEETKIILKEIQETNKEISK